MNGAAAPTDVAPNVQTNLLNASEMLSQAHEEILGLEGLLGCQEDVKPPTQPGEVMPTPTLPHLSQILLDEIRRLKQRIETVKHILGA